MTRACFKLEQIGNISASRARPCPCPLRPMPPRNPASKAAVLAELRGRIRRMEGIGGADGSRFLPLGVPAVDGLCRTADCRSAACTRSSARTIRSTAWRPASAPPSWRVSPGSMKLHIRGEMVWITRGRRSLRAGNRRLWPEAGAADRGERPARRRHPVGHGGGVALPLAGGGAGGNRRYRHGRQPPAATGGGGIGRHRPAAALRRPQAGRHRIGDALGPERRTQPAHRWRAGAGAAALADAAAPLPWRAAGRVAAGVARRRLRPGGRPGGGGEQPGEKPKPEWLQRISSSVW